MYRWMAGAAGSLGHAMLPGSGTAPWKRCSDGGGAAGQGLRGLRPQRIAPSLMVRSPSLSECKLQAKRTGAGLDGRLSLIFGPSTGRNYEVSCLAHAIPGHLVCTSSVHMEKKAQTGLGAGSRSPST